MGLFTLNTTAAYHFHIFELNGPISCSSEIQRLLLHVRQHGRLCSIDMIKCYQWTLWLVLKGQNGLIYTQYHCSWSFHHFRWKFNRQCWRPKNTTDSAPFRQQDQPESTDMIERYQWTLWSVSKDQNGLIYIQYHCSLWFWYFWSKWARQLQQQNTRTLLHLRQQGRPCSIDMIE